MCGATTSSFPFPSFPAHSLPACEGVTTTFFLLIHYSHATYQIMARLCTVRFLAAVRAVAARCKLPCALRAGMSPEDVMGTKGITKERKKVREEQRRDAAPAPTRFLRPQQKILWAEVKKETGRWKDRWKVRDLLADGRCSRAVLGFLSSTDVGRRVPQVEQDDAVSAVSELEVREWLEEQGAGRAPGTPCQQPPPRPPRGHHFSSPRPTSWRPQKRSRPRAGGVFAFHCSFLCLSH